LKHYRYLIVGGGLAGDAAVRGIRELDTEGSIGILGRENDPPYARPNLSKGLWKGRPIEKIWRNTQDLGADLYLGQTATYLNPTEKYLREETGDEFTYDKLLLATGGSPIRLPFGEEHIIYFRDLQDYRRLRARTERGERFLVLGGGYIGSELAAALTMIGKKAIMVFPGESIGAKIYPSDLSYFLNDFYREKGVEVVTGDAVVSIERTGGRFIVGTKRARSFEVDGIVGAIGIRPNVALAQQAGLQVDDGIVVNEHLLTSAPDIFAAGDVARFFHSALRKGVRVEHEDNALRMGKLAGRNMAGANEPYTHVPMFYSDLFELGYEAVGELNSKLETVADWEEPFKKGVVYYLDEGRVRGVLLWNVWDFVPEARALLSAPGPFSPSNLKGRLSGKDEQAASTVLLGANK